MISAPSSASSGRSCPAGPASITRAVHAALAVASLLALAGCGNGPPPTTFDLAGPSTAGAVRQSAGAHQLVISEPTGLQVFESDRIVVGGADGTLSYLPGAQWADRLPRLLQNRLVRSFENAGRAVAKSGAGVSGDAGLQWNVRFFGVSAEGAPQARVEVAAQLIDASSGRIARARVFRGSEPVGAVEPKAVTAALDEVSARVFAEIVRWSAGPVSAPRPAPPPGAPTDGRADIPPARADATAPEATNPPGKL